MGYQITGSQTQVIDIVSWLGRKCSLNVAGVGWINRIPISVFIIAGGMHSQPTIHCCDWNGVGFEQYPLIAVKGIR